jgi:flavodoxin
MKTLVAYFSASGNTASLAKRVAEAAKADLFEIKPVEPYTDADLRWTNPLARCNKEKIGKKNVPIENRVENFDEYELILIGFPIWYYAAPNIIETFVKSYDFTDKKVALFATSGGSDIAKAPAKLQPLMKGKIVGSKLFRADADFSELNAWVSSLK